ncbi:DUF4351 domain-containing protein [Okeania sp. KiyG1]|uniref:DUF4351 domain-containing protein n=1 Tax=Okeania sp. KiyG1 TaxID=2720165 RepID=UPI001924CDF3
MNAYEIAPEVQTQIEQLSLEKLDILGDEIFDARNYSRFGKLVESTTKIADGCLGSY